MLIAIAIGTAVLIVIVYLLKAAEAAAAEAAEEDLLDEDILENYNGECKCLYPKKLGKQATCMDKKVDGWHRDASECTTIDNENTCLSHRKGKMCEWKEYD